MKSNSSKPDPDSMGPSSYFKHEIGAMNDSMLSELIEDEGAKGLGVYWAVMEFLAASPDNVCTLKALNNTMRRLKVRTKYLLHILEDYRLFVLENHVVYSYKLNSLMAAYNAKVAMSRINLKGRKLYPKAYAVINQPDCRPELSEDGKEVEQDDVDLLQESESLLHDIRCLSQENENLSQENESLSQETESLSQETESLSQENESLSQKNESLSQKNESLSQKNASLSQENESLLQVNEKKNELTQPDNFSENGDKSLNISALASAETNGNSAPLLIEKNRIEKNRREHIPIESSKKTSATAEDKKGGGGEEGDKACNSLENKIKPGWEIFIDAACRDQSWKELMAMRSGMKMDFMNCFDEIIRLFKIHVQSFGGDEKINSEGAAKHYFSSYITQGSFTQKKLLKQLRALKPEMANVGQDPYRFEFRDPKTGLRNYNGTPIPADAPPRPSHEAMWDSHLNLWR